MSETSFPESALIANRVSVLLHGGLEDERRHWAEEAASHFSDEGPMREVRNAEELGACLCISRGVIYVPDVLKLGEQAQAALARTLFVQEERPKWVLGVVGTPESARERGVLREDLHYRLHRALVDLAVPGLRDRIERRRQERPVPRQPTARSPGATGQAAREARPSAKRTPTPAAVISAPAAGTAGPNGADPGTPTATRAHAPGASASARVAGPAAEAAAKKAHAAKPTAHVSDIGAQREAPAAAKASKKAAPAARSSPPRGGAARSATPKKAAKRDAAASRRPRS